MKTKKTFLKIGIFAIFMGIFGLSFTSATSFRINVNRESIAEFEQTIKDKIMYIHFADNGNDFGGLLYFSNGTGSKLSENPEFYINIDGSSETELNKFYECRKQIKGFYYNAQRGDRLRPLDKDTWSTWNSYGDFTGGIYTNCTQLGYEKAIDDCNEMQNNNTNIRNHENYDICIKNANETYSADGNGYFGSLTHTYSGQEMVLVMGVNYNTGDNGFISMVSGSDLAPTFVRLENKYPVGFVYDYNGGVGLAGCKFEEQNDQNMKILINEYYDNNNVDNGLMGIFEYNDDEGKMKYKGSISGINCEPISQADTLMRVVIEGIVGISNSAADISNAAFSAQGNSSNQKMQPFATKDINRNSLMNYVRKKAELLCRGKWKNFSTVYGDDNYHCGDNLPQLICYNGVGDAKCAADFLQGKTIIAKEGDLLISPDENYADGPYDIYVLSGNLIIKENDDRLYVFNESGYVMDDISTGDFNNAVRAAGGHYKGGSGATVASFLKGNFIVNGNIKGNNEDNLKHKYFIYGKFSSRENIDNLEDTFARKCYNGSGSDGNYCPEYTGNSYWNASLVVLDQNFPSPVMN